MPASSHSGRSSRKPSLSIGARLRLLLGSLLVLLAAGALLSIWQFQRISDGVISLGRLQEQTSAVVDIHQAILDLTGRLRAAAETRDSALFAKVTEEQLAQVQRSLEGPVHLLESDARSAQIEYPVRRSLLSLVRSIPERTRVYSEYARLGDWNTLRTVLSSHSDDTGGVMDTLLARTRSDLRSRVLKLQNELGQARRQALIILAITSVSSLLIATLLGWKIATSITVPLGKLTAMAKQLAAGDIGIQVQNVARDEIGDLTAALNTASRELQRLYQAVLDSERRFRVLIEKSSELILVLNSDASIRYVSPSVPAVLGVKPEALESGNLTRYIAPEARQSIADVLREPQRWESELVEMPVLAADGRSRMLECSLTTLHDDPSIGDILVHARDVTERRLVDEQTRQAQRMETVGRLAGGIAHDFNNLLTVINGHAALALESIASNPDLESSISEIRTAGERAASLTSQLLAFSRKQPARTALLDLSAITSEAENMLRRLIGEHIQLITRLAPDLPLARVDPGQLTQVVMNLAVNARDAMPDGGVLTIETSVATVGEHSKHVDLEPGEFVALTVSDTGSGMPPEVLRRVFEPFYTTKDQGKGTGLGLATVYGIVKQSKGSIVVSSELGKGTRFELLFPQAPGPEEPVAIDAPEAIRQWDGPANILVVEDQNEVRQLIRTVLDRGECRIFEAGTAMEAMKVLEAMRGRIDLLLTDVIMPTMSGKELADLVQTRYPHVKVLFMSGYTEEVAVLREVGSPNYIQKPFTREELVSHVAQVLNG